MSIIIIQFFGKVSGEDGGGGEDVSVAAIDPDGKEAVGTDIRAVDLFFN